MENARLKIVVKVEINTLLDHSGTLDESLMEHMAMVLSNLSNSGVQLFIVSSGSIFLGAKKLGENTSPESLVDKQALSAIGQAELMKRYRHFFEGYNLLVAQVLLTGDIFQDDDRRQNAGNTLSQLAEMNVIPVVNENDAVSTEDIELNDNYYLVKAVAELVDAHAILIKAERPEEYILLYRNDQIHSEQLHEYELIGMLDKTKDFLKSADYLSHPFPEDIKKLMKRFV